MIDRMLGGAGRPMDQIRPMTEIEQNVVQNVLRLLVDTLKESWRPAYAIDFSTTAVETHPHMLQIVAPSEMIILFRFQVRMRQVVGRLHLAMPTLVLEPIMHIFDQEWSTRKKIIHDGTLLQQLRYVPVRVSIATADTQFPVQSLLSLQVGDTLVLDQRTDWPVLIKVAEKNKLYARAKFDAGRKTFVVCGEARPIREEARLGHISS